MAIGRVPGTAEDEGEDGSLRGDQHHPAHRHLPGAADHLHGDQLGHREPGRGRRRKAGLKVNLPKGGAADVHAGHDRPVRGGARGRALVLSGNVVTQRAEEGAARGQGEEPQHDGGHPGRRGRSPRQGGRGDGDWRRAPASVSSPSACARQPRQQVGAGVLRAALHLRPCAERRVRDVERARCPRWRATRAEASTLGSTLRANQRAAWTLARRRTPCPPRRGRRLAELPSRAMPPRRAAASPPPPATSSQEAVRRQRRPARASPVLATSRAAPSRSTSGPPAPPRAPPPPCPAPGARGAPPRSRPRRQELLEVRAAGLAQLAADQVHRLDVVRALVDARRSSRRGSTARPGSP